MYCMIWHSRRGEGVRIQEQRTQGWHFSCQAKKGNHQQRRSQGIEARDVSGQWGLTLTLGEGDRAGSGATWGSALHDCRRAFSKAQV
jgi:hypothetical protein